MVKDYRINLALGISIFALILFVVYIFSETFLVLNLQKMRTEGSALYDGPEGSNDGLGERGPGVVLNKETERWINPLLPPERSYPYEPIRGGVPVNIPTRGESSHFEQLGVLLPENPYTGTNYGKPQDAEDDPTDETIPAGFREIANAIRESKNTRVLPLFGRQVYPGSREYNYFTSTDSTQSVKMPIVFNDQKCDTTHGCKEIYDGNVVQVEGMPGEWKAKLYERASPRYIPVVY